MEKKADLPEFERAGAIAAAPRWRERLPLLAEDWRLQRIGQSPTVVR
jgi:hypothetical protein